MKPQDEFLDRYIREFDFYATAARLCAQQLESRLEQSGVRAIVSHRAKRPDRLRDKVESRAATKAYAAVDDVYRDIVDLAGVRVALYFPGDQEEVARVIDAFCSVEATKTFPDSSGRAPYPKRFSGYAARHYRVRLSPGELGPDQQRYAAAPIEVQVASVLVHAWSEVEHDLVYKPLSGTLSDDEYAILDQLNGLVLAGEIALERLQRAAQVRLSKTDVRFNNHYELAAYIYDRIVKRGE